MWVLELPSDLFAFLLLILSPDNPVSREGLGDAFSALTALCCSSLRSWSQRLLWGQTWGGEKRRRALAVVVEGPRLDEFINRCHGGEEMMFILGTRSHMPDP